MKKKRKKKLNIIPKNKKCECGKKIIHHHYKCDDCWKRDKKTAELKRKAMRKNKLMFEDKKE